VELVDASDGTRLRCLVGHPNLVVGVAFSPDGTLLATAADDRTARTWDTTTGAHRTTLTGHTDWVRDVAFSPDGTLLATTAIDGTARTWDAITGAHRTTFTGHSSTVTGVAFSPDGRRLATASDDGTARIWETNTGACLATLVAFANGYAVLLPDGSYKLSGDPGGALWWAVKLCRFGPGELDPYAPDIRQLPADAAIPADR